MASHGRYTVLKKIADGGMAELFLASQSGLAGFERKVVLKRILPGLSADPHFRNMLVDEGLIAMGLTHGNIVQVMDLGCAGSRYFLVMELVDGWDLMTVLARAGKNRKALPIELCLYVLAEVCRGLFYAHTCQRDGRALGIVHRDVSPQNILISEQGEVKVTDFGIAKALGRREKTQTGIIKGKLDFMSPEQVEGAALDARSDVFSAGSVLYLCSTGQLPFPAATQMETMLRIQSAQYVPLREVAPDLAPGAVRVIARALAKAPSDRYQSGEEMMFDIEKVLRGELRAVGQSDLKLWLDDLGQRDRSAPISRQPGLPIEKDEHEVLGEGVSFALEDTSAVARVGSADTQVSPQRLAGPLAPASAPVDSAPPVAGSAKVGRVASLRARPTRRWLWRTMGNVVAGLVVAVALGAGIVYTVAPELWRRLITRGERAAVSTRDRLLEQVRDTDGEKPRTAPTRPVRRSPAVRVPRKVN